MQVFRRSRCLKCYCYSTLLYWRRLDSFRYAVAIGDTVRDPFRWHIMRNTPGVGFWYRFSCHNIGLIKLSQWQQSFASLRIREGLNLCYCFRWRCPCPVKLSPYCFRCLVLPRLQQLLPSFYIIVKFIDNTSKRKCLYNVPGMY